MITDILQLGESRCIALLGAGGKSTLQALLEKESARTGAERVFYEVGHAPGKDLKLYEDGTLSMRPETDCAVIVAGLGALDWPVGEVCDGFALCREFAADPAHPCGIHDLEYVVRETFRQTGLPKGRVRILLNQADTGMLHVRASDLLRSLQDDGISAAALSLLV